jgi:hypothetical protein
MERLQHLQVVVHLAVHKWALHDRIACTLASNLHHILILQGHARWGTWTPHIDHADRNARALAHDPDIGSLAAEVRLLAAFELAPEAGRVDDVVVRPGHQFLDVLIRAPPRHLAFIVDAPQERRVAWIERAFAEGCELLDVQLCSCVMLDGEEVTRKRSVEMC